MKGQNRSVVLLILFTFITCGIYHIYWMYAVTSEVNDYLQDNDTTGGMVILYSIITCGIYTFYWYYKMGKRLALCQERAGMRASDDSVLLLILPIFGLAIVSSAIIQSNLNNVWLAN